MKVKEIFEKSIIFFQEKKINNPRFETELLLASVLKTDRIGVYLKHEAPLTEIEINSLRELVIRKSKGEPTAYLIGAKYFYGREFTVGKGVLIPRPETELIVEEALSLFSGNKESNQDNKQLQYEILNIADLGSGTGCLGLTLGLEIPCSKVTLIEKSEVALHYTQENLNKLVDTKNQSRFKIFHQAIEEVSPSLPYHLIVANPPYIAKDDQEVDPSVKNFEPHEALYAENNGLSAISSWLEFVEKNLIPSGVCFFEIGYQQGQMVYDLFQSKKCFQSIKIIQDLNQRDRIIKAVKYG